MNRVSRLQPTWILAALPCLFAAAGCDATGHAKFTPTAVEARSSLEAALTAWRDGKPYGPIEAKPPVSVSDSLWQGGRQLESFEIGDEEDPGDGTKQFAVKLRFKKADKVEDARYVVNGRDPVWVHNAEDYQHMLGMDNKPSPPPKRSSSRSGGRR